MIKLKTVADATKSAVVLIFFAGVCMWAGGCSFLPAQKQEPPRTAAGLQALDLYAWGCYERGLRYMEESRFELAREQFSIAASSAVSETLYEDALDGLRRAEQVIQVKR